ncbi:hypothetical protein EL17_04320 [Anditalea andensis]|uniref:Uncharacterized protein n=1 Tax=Anditalea andensis TaxID=1048983 RepID=A0A074L331_9BACT|nr:hypothetical protein EL17_04320 [Anditalea andensis]
MGKSILEGDTFILRQSLRITGIKKEAAGITVIKADNIAGTELLINSSLLKLLPIRFSNFLAAKSTTPVRFSPSVMTNRPATVITAWLLNPIKLSSGLIDLVMTNESMTNIAMASGRMTPVKNKTNATPKIANTMTTAIGIMWMGNKGYSCNT